MQDRDNARHLIAANQHRWLQQVTVLMLRYAHTTMTIHQNIRVGETNDLIELRYA